MSENQVQNNDLVYFNDRLRIEDVKKYVVVTKVSDEEIEVAGNGFNLILARDWIPAGTLKNSEKIRFGDIIYVKDGVFSGIKFSSKAAKSSAKSSSPSGTARSF